MNKVIHKWALPVDDHLHAIPIKEGYRFIKVRALQYNQIEIWALYDLSAPDTVAYLRVFGTGQPIPDDDYQYIDTGWAEGLVWHVFEKRSSDD